MAVVGLGPNGRRSKGFSSWRQSTQLPIVNKSPWIKHETHVNNTGSLPKPARQSTMLLQSLKPFFRHSVTVQLLQDKSTADEQCYKLVRDIDGGLISTGDPRRLYRRYEQTISYNRINLTRRTFPYINDRPDRQTSPCKGTTPQVLTHLVNYCTIENKVYQRNDLPHEDYMKINGSPSRLQRRKSITKTNESDHPSISDISDVDIGDERLSINDYRLSTSPTDVRRLNKLQSRDRGTVHSRVWPSLDETSASPQCMSPQIIKITPRKKEPAVRKHATKKESKRRNKSHVAFAPPPSPDMSSKYMTTPGCYGAYLKPRSVPFL